MKIWYLGPFDAEVEWSFEINDLELEDGTELQLYNGSYGNLEWTDLGTVTVQNGTIQSNPDKPLGVLTSLVLVQKVACHKSSRIEACGTIERHKKMQISMRTKHVIKQY